MITGRNPAVEHVFFVAGFDVIAGCEQAPTRQTIFEFR